MANLSEDQSRALMLLQGKENIFLTGRAGSGKSFLVREYLKNSSSEEQPVLASTGAAALLLGGRTFHSFFGLGILEGGPERTIERALKNPKNVRRIKKAKTILVDEISMLSGETLDTAEKIACLARGHSEAWGGLRVIFVGDFAQLPPVTVKGKSVDWAFAHPVWDRSQLKPAILQKILRSTEESWLEVLNDVRAGLCSPRVKDALNARKLTSTREDLSDLEATRLFPFRSSAEEYNLYRLSLLSGDPSEIPTQYAGEEKYIESLKRQMPVPEVLLLKEGALVMFRRNDQEGYYVNGSLGYVRRITKDTITVELLDFGYEVALERTTFELYDGDGEVLATAKNFPLTLAYGTTIHKSQGATLNRMVANLASLWEAGQAYVALSRVRKAEDFFLEAWTPNSIKADPRVEDFHRSLAAHL